MKCYECSTGTIKKVIVKNYLATINCTTFIVENAEIYKCDTCDAELYSAKELRRWESLFKKLG